MAYAHVENLVRSENRLKNETCDITTFFISILVFVKYYLLNVFWERCKSEHIRNPFTLQILTENYGQTISAAYV